jgi:regulatory protein
VPERSLKARAIAMLARREHSVAEMRAKLATTGAPAEEVDATVAELVCSKLLSDARYAEALVRQQQARGHATRSIANALRERGVAEEAAHDAVAAADLDDGAALAALWQRRFGRAPADERERARQVRFLQSRGFALSAILKFLRSPPADPSGES